MFLPLRLINGLSKTFAFPSRKTLFIIFLPAIFIILTMSKLLANIRLLSYILNVNKYNYY